MTYCDHSNQEASPFILPKLPYDTGAFKPHLSVESFEYHYAKHHQAYVNNLNNLLQQHQEFSGMDLEEIIKTSKHSNSAVFNNAAQIWNHSFFWHSIKPNGGGKPTGKLAELINQAFGSYEKFSEEFKQAAVSQFGSGWAWLVYNYDQQKLQIVKTANADTPLTSENAPLLACDVWEHAYYIDYRNKRPDYVTTFLNHLVNWDFANMHLNRAIQ